MFSTTVSGKRLEVSAVRAETTEITILLDGNLFSRIEETSPAEARKKLKEMIGSTSSSQIIISFEDMQKMHETFHGSTKSPKREPKNGDRRYFMEAGAVLEYRND